MNLKQNGEDRDEIKEIHIEPNIVPEKKKENNTTKITGYDEDSVLDDKHGDECDVTIRNQIETNIVKENTKTKGKKGKNLKEDKRTLENQEEKIRRNKKSKTQLCIR